MVDTVNLSCRYFALFVESISVTNIEDWKYCFVQMVSPLDWLPNVVVVPKDRKFSFVEVFRRI